MNEPPRSIQLLMHSAMCRYNHNPQKDRNLADQELKSRTSRILGDLRTLHRRISQEAWIGPVCALLALLLSGVILLTLLESIFYLSAWGKSAGWIIVTGFSVILFIKFSGKARVQPFREFCHTFCKQAGFTEIGNAIDLFLDPRSEDSPFYELAIRRNLESFRPDAWSGKLSNYRKEAPQHKRFLAGVSFLLLALLLFGGVLFSQTDALKRTITFWKTTEMPNPYQFVVVPGDQTLEYGSPFSPSITFSGNRMPNQVSLALKTDIEQEFRIRPMNPAEEGTYASGEMELTNDGTYYIEMDGFRTEEFRVDVRHLPRFESLTVQVTPPSYTELPESTHTYPFARIRAYGGSEITLTGSLNKSVSELSVRQGGDVRPVDVMDPDSFRFTYSFTAEENDTLHFTMTDRDGLTNRNPFQFTVNLIRDEYPSITILEPEQSVRIAEPTSLDILYRATDDFGLTGAELEWKLQRAFTTDPLSGSEPLETPASGTVNSHNWDLHALELRPRDRLDFSIVVRDNDGWNGYKMTRSRTLSLEVPSMSAWMEDVGDRERNVEESLDEVSERYREMEETYRQFRNRLQENPEPGWEEEQMLNDVRSRQEEVEDSISQLQDQFEEIRRELEESNTISDETRRTYRELQELMEELDDPELRRAMEELQDILRNLNPQDLQQALDQFEFNEQVYRERLERTVELFKMLKMNSDLDKLAQQYEELGNRMESTMDESRSSGEIRDEQMGVREDSESLDRQLENLDRNPPRRHARQLEQLREESRQELIEIMQKLDELIEQTAGDPDNAVPEGAERREELGEQFRERAETLRNARQQMSGQQIQINLLAMQRSLYTLIELSESQEEIALETGVTQTRSQGYVELARRQHNINELFSQVSDTLTQIAAEIPSLSGIITRKKVEVEQTLQRARSQMADRDQRTSVITSRESLGGINDLASMLATAIDQLMDQQDGEGGSMSMQQMLQEMQQMSGDQQELNRQLQELINDIQGERLSQEQSDRLEQITQQQNEIRRQLQELQRSGALRQGDQTLSEIQRMIEEMEDAINDMRGGMTDPIMTRRQQNILSRMLRAEESLQQRGEAEDEYRGQAAESYQRPIPPDITLEELRQEIRTRLQDPAYTRFRDEYQLLIERYFDLLRQLDPEL